MCLEHSSLSCTIIYLLFFVVNNVLIFVIKSKMTVAMQRHVSARLYNQLPVYMKVQLHYTPILNL